MSASEWPRTMTEGEFTEAVRAEVERQVAQREGELRREFKEQQKAELDRTLEEHNLQWQAKISGAMDAVQRYWQPWAALNNGSGPLGDLVQGAI